MRGISIDRPRDDGIGEKDEKEGDIDKVDLGLEIEFAFVGSGIAAGKEDLDGISHVHVSKTRQHKSSVPQTLGQHVVYHVSDSEHDGFDFYLVSNVLVHIEHGVEDADSFLPFVHLGTHV